jgi:hypothetical protein
MPLPPDALRVLEANLSRLRERIGAAAQRVGRDPGQIAILPATKYVGAEVHRLLHRTGLHDFAENTVQAVEAKRRALVDLEDVRWHLIGHLQRNKTARALKLVSTIHSLDSVRLAREIGAQVRARGLPVPGVYVEVNISEERQKTGLPPGELRQLLGVLRQDDILPDWQRDLRGLMAMAPYSEDPEAARPYFRKLRELRDALLRDGLLPQGAGLSMGMSADFPVAVEEGATVVRIGSALFEGLVAS